MQLRDPEVIGVWRQKEILEAVHLEAPMYCVKGQYAFFHLHWTVTAEHCIHTNYKMERKKEMKKNQKMKL